MYPIKFAVTEQQIADKNYILVEPCATTLANWKVVKGKNKVTDEEIYVRLEGDEPKNLSYNILSGDNIYVCYGEFLEHGDLHGERYHRFYVNKWDILYPISRNSIFDFIMPDNYMCKLDFE